jgi:N-methylhydantoinase A
MGVKRLRVAVDTGGTFTDFVVLDEVSGTLDVFKVPSTRGREADGIVEGLQAYLARTGADGTDVAFFSHGTTVGTNGLLEGNGARTGLLVTRGFRGIYEVGEQSRPYGSAMYDLFYDRPPALVPARLTAEIVERVAFDGTVVEDLDELPARAAIERLAAHGVESLAVCLLFSFRNPQHERRIGELVAEVAPHVNVSLSCDVAPQIREYYRLSTTVVNAYLNPLLARYIRSLGERIAAMIGAETPRYIMRSNGGVATFEVAARRSVQTILSGPAGGVVAAGQTLAATAGYDDAITFDMGGTSSDVALIRNGAPARAPGGKVHERDILVSMLDIHTVAAGGGTIASVDASGVLNVGPQSAGADPGPACYGRGGTQPTVTDANLVLGLLSDDAPLAGGSLRLDRRAAEDAIRRGVADPLGLSVIEAAAGIVEIVNVKMQEAIKVISSNRGFDLRDFHLLAYGGAGPLHAAALARDLGMRGVLVPPFPGAFSALGLLLADVRQDYVRSELIAIDAVDVAHVAQVFEQLRDDGAADLRAQGFAAAALGTEFALDLRYVGQGYELTVTVAAIPRSAGDLTAIRAAFDAQHAQLTGHAAPSERVEIVNYRATAVATVPHAPLASPFTAGANVESAQIGERVTHAGGIAAATAVYDRARLPVAAPIHGPALLLQPDSTTFVLQGQTATVVANGLIEIRTSTRPSLSGEVRVP